MFLSYISLKQTRFFNYALQTFTQTYNVKNKSIQSAKVPPAITNSEEQFESFIEQQYLKKPIS
jgi:hypothetical protein